MPVVPDFHGSASGFTPLNKMPGFELAMYIYNHIKVFIIVTLLSALNTRSEC